MITTNYRARFSDNNFASSAYLTEYSSYKTGYSYLNIFDTNRSKKWVSNYCFVIDSTNNKIYINDSIDKTITLTSSKYSATTLATHITSQLNAASSNWTCSYSSTTRLFTISRTTSATLRFSQTANAAWNSLGYVITSDQTATSFVAQLPRIHTEEYFIFDLKEEKPIDFIALISPIDEIFGISKAATITLEGSNLNYFTSPAISINIPIYDNGAFKFIDDQYSTYRYWRLRINDQMNDAGEISFSHLYLGDYTTITQSNISIGIEEIENDTTTQTSAESGKLYFDENLKYTEFNSLAIDSIRLADKTTLLDMWSRIGKSTPFYISIDPTACASNDVSSTTRFVYFNNMPSFKHIIYDIWSMSFSVREVI
ncbi:MAG: hypothetical protein ACP5N7_01125 [Candidatus Pacearchaeota archaeon]